MKYSTQRILTTHTGSLPRPADLQQMLAASCLALALVQLDPLLRRSSHPPAFYLSLGQPWWSMIFPQ
jgi:hypothetical protein